MYDLPEAPEVVTALAALIASVAALYGAFVAHKGLDSWKRDKESDFAREISRELIRYKRALHDVRVPGLTEAEHETADLTKSHRVMFRSLFFKRWRFAVSARDSLDPLIFEAQLRWGDHAIEAFRPITAASDKLMSAIVQYSLVQGQIDRQNELFAAGGSDAEAKLESLLDELEKLERKLFDDYQPDNPMRFEIENAFSQFDMLLARKI
ncbi:hypothetical protein [Pseudooceanicola sp. MF1-13]|uniref:hypothetical protein n=1 Tax=Pseudooceanicola sp. MF1-13 TaxID=3379095 RepID=UPI0038911F57